MITEAEIQLYDGLMKSRMTDNSVMQRPIIENVLSNFVEEIKYLHKHKMLQILLSFEEFFQKLLNDTEVLTKASLKELMCLLLKEPSHYERMNLCKNTALFLHMLEVDVFDVEKFFMKLHSHGLLFFLGNEILLEKMHERGLLTEPVLSAVLKNTTDILEHQKFCEAASLLESFFDSNLCTLSQYKTFNKKFHNKQVYVVEPNQVVVSEDFFRFVELLHADNESLLRKSRFCESISNLHTLSEKQKRALKKVASNSRNSSDVLFQIYKNNLQDQYDFGTLMRMLAKDDKKMKVKLNF